mmetsp:Transcript_19040/g.37094  ORF Transcript_19040/g.37094 Transcript_19040/m.37094 type:complete len:205 (-) Transcript_19040:34-648(-)
MRRFCFRISPPRSGWASIGGTGNGWSGGAGTSSLAEDTRMCLSSRGRCTSPMSLKMATTTCITASSASLRWCTCPHIFSRSSWRCRLATRKRRLLSPPHRLRRRGQRMPTLACSCRQEAGDRRSDRLRWARLLSRTSLLTTAWICPSLRFRLRSSSDTRGSTCGLVCRERPPSTSLRSARQPNVSFHLLSRTRETTANLKLASS